MNKVADKKSKVKTKDARQAVIVKLETALAEFKTLMGEKKFQKSVIKASKLFVTKKPAQPIVKKQPAATKKKNKKAVQVKAATKAPAKAVATKGKK